MTIVRFAPSPTGHLHAGNLRTALLNALFARARGGRFILRLDDTDAARSRENYAEAIRDDLAWAGLDPYTEYRQSQRTALYEAAAARLKAAGLLYPCYETPDALERARAQARARGLPPVYDRRALGETAADRARHEAAGRRPHWRFRLPDETVTWNDMMRGAQQIALETLSDPVLIREDGAFLYTLPSVVDDIEMGITHVIRGEDHVTNTAVQIALARALDGTPPAFGHHSMIVGPDGAKLSKREGGFAVRDIRAAGIEPMTLNAHLAALGTGQAADPAATLDSLAQAFDPAAFGRAPARFDPAELLVLNAKRLHGMDYDAAAPRLSGLGIGGGAPFWLAARANLERFDDAAAIWASVDHPVPVIDEGDRAFLRAAAVLLPPEPWDDQTWSAWTGAVSAATGRKGRALFRPLRLALTGAEHGPELAKLLSLIGRDRALARLGAEGHRA